MLCAAPWSPLPAAPSAFQFQKPDRRWIRSRYRMSLLLTLTRPWILRVAAVLAVLAALLGSGLTARSAG